MLVHIYIYIYMHIHIHIQYMYIYTCVYVYVTDYMCFYRISCCCVFMCLSLLSCLVASLLPIVAVSLFCVGCCVIVYSVLYCMCLCLSCLRGSGFSSRVQSWQNCYMFMFVHVSVYEHIYIYICI